MQKLAALEAEEDAAYRIPLRQVHGCHADSAAPRPLWGRPTDPPPPRGVWSVACKVPSGANGSNMRGMKCGLRFPLADLLFLSVQQRIRWPRTLSKGEGDDVVANTHRDKAIGEGTERKTALVNRAAGLKGAKGRK